MNDQLLFVLTFVAALGSGLIAGVFFGFSAFIMKALARISPEKGIAAMQSINIVVINPWFLTVFLGTAAVCALLVVSAIVSWQNASSKYMLAGSLFYLFGTILVTMIYNVPRNNSLASVDPGSENGANLWISYVKSWTAWNHVRTIAALVAAGFFSIALCQ